MKGFRLLAAAALAAGALMCAYASGPGADPLWLGAALAQGFGCLAFGISYIVTPRRNS